MQLWADHKKAQQLLVAAEKEQTERQEAYDSLKEKEAEKEEPPSSLGASNW